MVANYKTVDGKLFDARAEPAPACVYQNWKENPSLVYGVLTESMFSMAFKEYEYNRNSTKVVDTLLTRLDLILGTSRVLLFHLIHAISRDKF